MSAEEKIAGLLDEHEYSLGMIRGSICLCGHVPTVTPESLRTQQDYHRAHVAAVLAESGIGDARQAEADYSEWLQRATDAENERDALRERLAKVEGLADEWLSAGVVEDRNYPNDVTQAEDMCARALRAALGEQP